MDLKVIAIDPGVTTGIANGVVQGNELKFEAWEEHWLSDQKHKMLYRYLVTNSPHVIVYETFEFRNKARAKVELFSRELIGVIRLYGELNNGVRVIEQTPAQAMGHFSNEKLKEMDCYTKGSEHQRDATRHMLYWWTFGHGFQYRGPDGTHEMIK